ncbi:hypothetical protein [Glutamicibacter protophormiae]
MEINALELAVAIIQWPQWCHRRVDKYEPLGSDRGRSQHSIDCTIPASLPDYYVPNFADGITETSSNSQVIVPVALVAKGTLQEFDARNSSDESIPVLTRRENSSISATMLEALFLEQAGILSDASSELLSEAVHTIVGDSANALSVAQELLQAGRFLNKKIIDPELFPVDGLIHTMTLNLAQGFLLFVVLPKECRNQRVVIKISYSWNFDVGLSRTAKRRAFLTGRRSLTLPMTGPSDAGSYHLEFRIPQSVRCKGMRIPNPNELVEVGAAEDNSELSSRDSNYSTIHLNASYKSPPQVNGAWLELHGAKSLLSWASLIGSFIASGLMWMLVLYQSQVVTDATYSSAIALFVTLPALFLGFVSIREDHSLGQHMALAHRIVLIIQALLLFFTAGVPLVTKDACVIRILWLIFASAGTLLWLLAILRQFVGQVAKSRFMRVLYYGANQPELSLEQEWRLNL